MTTLLTLSPPSFSSGLFVPMKEVRVHGNMAMSQAGLSKWSGSIGSALGFGGGVSLPDVRRLRLRRDDPGR